MTLSLLIPGFAVALGWVFLHGLRYFADNAWKALGESAGCLAYDPQVIIRHYHYTFGTAPRDATYAEAEPGWERDKAVFEAWAADPAGLARDAGRIRELMA